jgi:signal transduction histidine kinase
MYDTFASPDRSPAVAEDADAVRQMREQFFTIASHDLQHPISNIYAAQRLLRETTSGDPAATELLDEIELSLEVMQEIIRDYLETAALQAGALDLRLETADVEEMLWAAAAQHAAAAQKKGIIVSIPIAEGCALADPRRLAQAVNNLLSNALKYSPPGSQVRLTGMACGDRVRISVQDQGPGIPPAERARLFSQFGRTSARPTGGENSTGLGLWIVRQLMAMQNGRAGVDCPPEGGSIFWLDLPAAP